MLSLWGFIDRFRLRLFRLLCYAEAVWLTLSDSVLFHSASGEASNFGSVAIVTFKVRESQLVIQFKKPARLNDSFGKTFAAAEFIEEFFCNV